MKANISQLKRKLSYMPLTGLALISLASSSYAGDFGFGWDYKTIPGAACQPQIGAQAGNFERFPHSILNVSRTASTVICPIVRDTVHVTPLDIGVTVTKGVKCQFSIMNYAGNEDHPRSPFDPTSITDLGGDREIQYFEVLKAKKIDPEGFVGYYALQCTLPPDTEVFSYISGEQAKTTDYGE